MRSVISGGTVTFYSYGTGPTGRVVGGVTSVNGETGDVVLDLGDLNDVELGLAGPSIGDIIAWDGNNWVSTAAPPADISGSSIGDLNDVRHDRRERWRHPRLERICW